MKEKWVDRIAGGEDAFGLGVSVGLPGKHAELVLFEPVMVEPLARMMVVNDPVGRFRRGAEGPLHFDEQRVGFGEGAEVLGPVVSGECIFGGLVESDPHIPVGGLVVDHDVIFGGKSDCPVFLSGPAGDAAAP